MPRQYSHGGRDTLRPPGSGGIRGIQPISQGARRSAEKSASLPADGMAHQPRIDRGITGVAAASGRIPVITLYVGKLIIDDVVLLVQTPHKPETLRLWLDSGLLNWLGLLLLAEFALAVLADILGRVVSLIDGLLSERVTNASSVRLMQHAATLDLRDFEDSEFQDQLERARRQTSGRMSLMGQLFGQAQDIVTVVSFAAGLIFYAPWLIVLLVFGPRSGVCRRGAFQRPKLFA